MTLPGILLGFQYRAQKELAKMWDANGTSPQRTVLDEPGLQRLGSEIQGPFHTGSRY